MLIRYYGHVGVPTGYGVAANETCMAMLEAGFDLEISTNGQELHKRYLPLASRIRASEDLSPPDVVMVHTLPMDCVKLLALPEVRQHPNAHTIAYTTWEGATPIPSEMADALSPFDQVWVPSTRTRVLVEDGIAHYVSSQAIDHVHVVPHAYDAGLWDADENTWPRKDDRYTFYYVGAHAARKNVEGLLRAFIRAFDASSETKLIVQSAGADRQVLERAMLSTGIPPHRMPPIEICTDRLSDEQIVELHRRCHCFVTATRGEAWNLGAFDAMLAGNHIIAPGMQGSDGYLSATSADLYHSYIAPAYGDVRLVKHAGVPAGHAIAQVVTPQGLTVLADWREPALNDLSQLMRFAYKQRSALKVSHDPQKLYGRAAVGNRIHKLVTEALERKNTP